MSFSIYSLIMAVLWFDAFILLSSGIRKKTDFLLQYSLLPLIILIIVSLTRMMLPLELPFATVLRSQRLFPLMQSIYNHKFSLGGFQVTLLCLFLGFCSLVSVILLIRLFLNLHQGNHKIQVLYTEENARAKLILQNIIKQTKPGQDCTLHIAPGIASPIVTGFLHPVILMPENTKLLSDKQLHYILRHEWSHYLSKDLWVKLLIHILCCVMWWNPPVHLLKKDLNQILELNCDRRVTRGMKETERLEYLQTIMEVLKQYYGNENHMLVGVNFVGAGKGESTMQRFQLVYDHQKSIANWKTNVMFFLIMAILFLLSFSFILQPFTPAPPVEEEFSDCYIITPENAYLKLEEDGTYSLYLNGTYFDSIAATERQQGPYNLLPIKN